MAVNKHGQDDAAIPALVRIKSVLGQLDKYGMEGIDWGGSCSRSRSCPGAWVCHCRRGENG